MSGAHGVERVCKDCGVPVEHAGGKGRWPERCPEHRRQRKAQTHAEKESRQRRDAARKAAERSCLDCGATLQRFSRKWPVRCPGCQAKNAKVVNQARRDRKRPTHIATCPDCGGQRQVTRSSHLEARCPPCARKRASRQTVERAKANPEAARAAARRWRENNPDKVSNRNHARRAVTWGVVSEDVEIAVLVERDGIQCSLCPAEIDLELKWPHPGSKSIDHVIPIARSGSHTYENVALAHLVCNISKCASDAPQTRYSDLLVASAS